MAKELIGVIGVRACDSETYRKAYEVGKAIALNGYGLVSGGMGGVMEAASKGCSEHGGISVGILPQDTADYGNKYLTIVIPTGMGIMRNLLVVRASKGLVAVNGKYGTLSEIAYALQLEKPIVGIDTWNVSSDLEQFEDATSAVKQLLKML